LYSQDGGARESVCRFRVEGGSLRSVAYDETLRRPDRKVVSEEHLDFVNGEALDKISGKSFHWPKNIYAAAVNFFMWSDYDPFTTMYAILDGRERITVPAGTFDCFRLRMNVNTEHIIRSLELPMPQAYDMARDIAGQMRPEDTIFWYTAAPPHLFVKRQGAMGPPGTSRGIVERTVLSPGARAALANPQP
jgi:hypothetical protein